jgi:hypothetical protein
MEAFDNELFGPSLSDTSKDDAHAVELANILNLVWVLVFTKDTDEKN